MKKQSMFGGMSAIEVMRYINGDSDNFENNKERHFSEEVLGGPMTAKEITEFFRKTELNGEKGWRVTRTECEYSREHEDYMCPQSYYRISATFVRR